MMQVRKRLLAVGVACALGGAVSSAQAATLTDIDTVFGSFDASSGTRSFTLGSGSIFDVNINIVFAKCDDPSLGATQPAIGTGCTGTGFSYDREIVFTLTHGSTTVNLINEDTWGGQTPGAGVVSMTFDMGGAVLPGGPTTGSFIPVGNLADFDGFDAAGLWTLYIEDTAGADRLDYWESTLTVETVPEPFSLGLVGLGLLGLGFARRRKLT